MTAHHTSSHTNHARTAKGGQTSASVTKAREAVAAAQRQTNGQGQESPLAPRKQLPNKQRRAHTIVAPDEAVAVLVLQLGVHILLCLLHGDVHEAVQARKDACVAAEHADKTKQAGHLQGDNQEPRQTQALAARVAAIVVYLIHVVEQPVPRESPRTSILDT
jgi:hypothetical protein